MGTINKVQQLNINANINVISALAFLPLGILLFIISIPVASSSEALTCKQMGKLAAYSPDCQGVGNSNKNTKTPTSSSSELDSEYSKNSLGWVKVYGVSNLDGVLDFYVNTESVKRQGYDVRYNTRAILETSNGQARSNVVTVNIGNCYNIEVFSIASYDGDTGYHIKSGLTPKREVLKGSVDYELLEYACGL